MFLASTIHSVSSTKEDASSKTKNRKMPILAASSTIERELLMGYFPMELIYVDRELAPDCDKLIPTVPETLFL
ncbi:hypothetical protein T4E_2478 [Trichinella pseudospiralis]|uniref:Uncharacterized protein n=1 Tax=Trichinella pseudospiralis TaxID=6337 RepID=A0A0V0XV55_TRIPS|nr:hypothetical protein T4E_2478 [Trichinella pseudospiralis]KRY87486.1 hypothetical protein T4D_5060 [Trichinella pseudospiralis]